MKNKFCIKTRGPDHSKQIIETLVKLGYRNRGWDGTGNDMYYFVDEEYTIGYGSSRYPEIQLKDLEGNVKIKYNYLIL